MPTLELPLAGSSYNSKATKQASGSSINMYRHLDAEGREQAYMRGFPGLKVFGDVGEAFGERFRGMAAFTIHTGQGQSPDLVYIAKTSSHSVFNSAGSVVVTVGTAALTSALQNEQRAVIAWVKNSSGDDSLVWVYGDCGGGPTNDVIYSLPQTDPADAIGSSTNTAKPNMLTFPGSVAYINRQALYFDNYGMNTSAVNDPLTFADADFLPYEASADKLIRGYATRSYVYRFAETTIEILWNNGSGRPPFARLQNGVLNFGIAGRLAIHDIDDVMVFLDNNREPREMVGMQAVSISNPSIGREFASYERVDDVVVRCIKLESQTFYVFYFEHANRTWVYYKPLQEWHRLTKGVDGDAYPFAEYVKCYGKDLVADPHSGQIYEMDFDTYTVAGDVMIRERVTQPIHSKLFKLPSGLTLFTDRLELVAEMGVGLTTGQGSTPQVMMSYSDDAGQTWSSEELGEMGAGNQKQLRLEWFQLGDSTERIYKFRVSDPVQVDFISLHADIEFEAA